MIIRILEYLLSKFAKSHAEEIKKANLWVDKAQSQFQKMILEAEKSEEHLEDIAEEARVKMDELREILSQANYDKQRTAQFKHRVKDFVGE